MGASVDYVALGKRIQKRRQFLMLTQIEVAQMAGISLSFYGHIERGSRKSSTETLVRIAMALGTTTSDLLSDSLNMERAESEERRGRGLPDKFFTDITPETPVSRDDYDILSEIITDLRKIIGRLEEHMERAHGAPRDMR